MKYIKYYDNVITKEYCDHLRNKFHDNRSIQIEHKNPFFIFNEINITENINVYREEVEYLTQVFDLFVDYYKEDCDIQYWQFPDTYGFESIRHKCYPADHGLFNPHIDARDSRSMKRFLVFFLYLDEGEGGQTIMYNQKVFIDRKPGRLLMFPPMWTYPHAGAMPKGNDKHIIGSYLHFV